MKIIISGVTGYLGSHLAEKLSSTHEVIGLKRSNSSTSRIEKINNLKLIDVDNEDFCTEICRQVKSADIIINAAGSYGRKNESLEDIIQANILFPLRLYELSEALQATLYINTGTSLPPDVNFYALTKNQFVDWVRNGSVESRTKFINVRLEHFYGPGDDTNKFISFVIDHCLKNEPINVTEGCQERDFIYIDDVVSAYSSILENHNKLNYFENVPVGSGKTIRLKDLIQIIHELTNSQSILNFGVIQYRPNEVMHSCADLTIMKKLNWAPSISLLRGLELTLGEEND